MSITLKAGTRRLDLSLTPKSATLYGLIRDADTGNPIPKVTVDIWQTINGAVNIKTTLTDTSGSYRITEATQWEGKILPGSYSVWFSCTGYKTLKMGITLTIAEVKELNVQLHKPYYPTVHIHGRCVDSDTLAPILGVLAQLLGTAFSTYTDSAGYYAIYSVPAGTYTLSFTHPDYTQVQKIIILGAEEAATINVSMTLLAVEKVLLSGRIMNEAGDPIPWTDVFVYPPPYPEGGQIRLKADGQGYYEAVKDVETKKIIVLQPGLYYIVAAAISPPRYEIGTQWVTLNYGENVVDFYLKLWAE